MSSRRLLMAALVSGSVVACRPDDQRTETLDATVLRAELDFEVVAQLDSGNAAYRAGDYDTALRHYVSVTELEPGTAAGWFGVYLAEQRRGNGEEAASALDRARRAAPGASLLRQQPGDTIR